MRLKEWVPGPLRPPARRLYFAAYRKWIRLECCYRDLRGPGKGIDGLPLPPAALRFRVSESMDPEVFLAQGRKIAETIRGCLADVGRPLESFRTILDFGCGCARTLIWMARYVPDEALYGCDVDEESIGWCREHMPLAGFEANRPAPPLSWPDGRFGLIYGISVLTHLDEESQFQWLAELGRLLEPGGIALLTVHGERAWGILPEEDVTALKARGFLFRRSSKLRGIVPDWYHTAFHSEEYVRREFARWFAVVDYRPGGMGVQDVVVLKRGE